MSRKIKNEQKKFLGETLNQYDKALSEGIEQLDKKNREQNHKISSLVNSFDNEFLEKDVEGNMTALENSKDGMVIINEIQGSTEVNYCKDGEKELILNGDIDTQGESFVTITEGVDGGLVDVSLEGNTEINLSKTKDPVLVTREFDDINCNVGKLQYTIDDVTTINDEPGKVDIDRIVGDTMVNHAVNGSEELILNAHINESGDNNITLNGVTSDGGKVDVALEGNTLVNVSNVKDDYITPTIEDKVDQGSVISLPEVSEGLIHIDEIEGNTMVNYCTDGVKELTLNGDIDVEGISATTTEGVDNGLVDVVCEGNTLVNLCQNKGVDILNSKLYGVSGKGTINLTEIENGCKYTTISGTDSYITVRLDSHTVIKPNTTYTLVFEIEKNTLNFEYRGITISGMRDSYYGRTDSIVHNSGFALTVGIKKISFITPNDISTYTGFGYGLPPLNSSNVTEPGMEFVIKNTMLLEGDWTDKEIPDYFEGMKSVGQDDENGHKVEIVSSNDINGNNYYFETDKIVLPNGTRNILSNNDYTVKIGKVVIDGTHNFVENSIYGSVNTYRYAVYIPNMNINSENNQNSLGDTLDWKFDDSDTVHYKIGMAPDTLFLYIPIEYKDRPNEYFAKNPFTLYYEYTEPINIKLDKKEILLNEPLRSLPNGIKDRFVKIDGKWFIERNCVEKILDGSEDEKWETGYNANDEVNHFKTFTVARDSIQSINMPLKCDKVNVTTHQVLDEGSGYGINLSYYLRINLVNCDAKNGATVDDLKQYLQQNPVTVVYQLSTPIYEPLEIEPTLNTYNDTTHLSNNSIIPCNMQIKNTGYNAIIKPSTLYTIALDTNKQGTVGINLAGAEVTTTNNVATITTPETLTDDSLRLYGKGIKASKVRLLEGDKTNWIPSFFEGMKSSFEDKVQTDGSYKMEILMNNKNLVKLKSENVYGLDVGSSYIIHSENSLTLNGTKDFSFIRIKQKLKPLTKYYISCDTTLRKGSRAGVRVIENRPGVPDTHTELYSVNSITTGNKIHIEGTFTTKYTPNLAIMLNSSWETVEDSELLIENLQISEVAGEFVENKSNKIQLSSIEPLRGVGKVKDRLVFKDGKLMIERNCKQSIFDNNTGLIDLYNLEDINVAKFAFRGVQPRMELYQIVKCDKFGSKPYNSNIGIESVSVGGSNDLHVYIDKRKLPSLTLEGVKEWLQSNPLTVTYQLAEPTYEEIPYDLQKIILESYANGTLFFDTNIPPTKVSFNCFEEELTYLYPSTSYTVQFNSDRATTADVNLGGTELLAQNITRGFNRISMTTPSELADSKLIINGTGAKISEVVVTNTDREFAYFEGMKSVGECEDNKIEVLSNNENYCPNDVKVVENKVWASYDCEKVTVIGYNCTDKLINVLPNTDYTLSINGVNATGNIWFYDKNKSAISQSFVSPFTTPPNTKYISFHGLPSVLPVGGEIMLNLTKTQKDYIPHQSNTQQLTHEPLRAVGNVKDRYVMVDGKWYIERKCKEVVLDGSDDEVWGATGGGGSDTRNTFEYVVDNAKYINTTVSTTAVSNRVKYEAIRQIPTEDNCFRLAVSSSYYGYLLFTPSIDIIPYRDLVSWRAYLSSNPVVVIYPLQTPIYEPLDYNPLETYADVTHITTNSAIPTNITVKNHGYNLVALKENTQYTLYVNKDTTNTLTYRLGDYVEINSQSKFTFTTPSTLTDKTLRIDGKGAKVNDLMLIEGTPTNDSIGYFDGLKSSYECEQVTDETDENYGKYKVDVKVVGKNLFDKSLAPSNGNTGMIDVKPNTTYYFYGESHMDNGALAWLSEFDSHGNRVALSTIWTDRFTTGQSTKKIILNANVSIIDSVVLSLTPATEYEPYFESKQTIYLNSPLLKGDEIVWRDNKIQHYHKMGRVVLDGGDDEGWGAVEDKGRFIKFGRDALDFKFYPGDSHKLYCDILPTNTEIVETEIERLTLFCHNENYRELRCNLLKSRLSKLNVEGLKQWLQANPVTVVYELATPYYEEISDYPLKLNVIANSSLSTESTIQVTNISFNIYEETLPYLYPNTKYYITFNADVDRNNIIIDLGGNHVVFDCKVGFNKVEITTPNDTTNLLTFSGTGVNIDHVKVTQQDIDEYFEGMKSVGECEDLAITSANSDNTLLTTQTLTHEPLRAVGDVKDRYVLIDGKWYIERNCEEVVLDGNRDYFEYRNSEEFYGAGTYIGNMKSALCQCDSVIVDRNEGYVYNETKEAIWFNNANGFAYLLLKKSRLSTKDLNGFKTYLQSNPVTAVYELQTPTYEPIDYNPLEVYSGTTHITTNSTIPTNITVKNHGYNCILKPSTKYTIALNKPNGTISAKLGGSAKVDSTNSIFTITTPSTLNDNVLRLSGSGNVKDIMILEGDKTVNTPSYFEGIESVFEQEYDAEKGKYRVTAKVIEKNIMNQNSGVYNTDLNSNTICFPVLSNTTYTYSSSVYKSYISIYELTKAYPNDISSKEINKHSIKTYPIQSGDSFTTSPTTKYIFMNYNGGDDVQVEQGDKATAYEPYKESEVTFYIDEPLRGVKDVRDRVFIQDGKVVVQRNCGYYIFNENTPWIGSDHVNRGHWIRVNDNNIPNYKPNLNPILSIPSISSPMGYPYWQNKDNEIEIFWDWSGTHMYIFLHSAKTKWDVKVDYGVDDISNYMKNNPIEMVYELAEPVYEEVDCDLSKLILENYENSSLIFESNIPVSTNIKYSGEIPVVTQAKALSSKVDNTTFDINENIIPYMCDIDYRIVELQLMNGDTQGEGIELLGIGDIEILSNENVLFNNREDKKHNFSYDMLKRDILSQRYSKEEYRYRLDRYLLANKISDEEYKELEGLLNNGE